MGTLEGVSVDRGSEERQREATGNAEDRERWKFWKIRDVLRCNVSFFRFIYSVICDRYERPQACSRKSS